MKFGGTSMARPELVAEIIEDLPHSSAIIVSAPGRIPDDNAKVTDLLIEYTNVAGNPNGNIARNQRSAIIDRYNHAYESMASKLRSPLNRRFNQLLQREDMPSEYYESLGERMSAEYFAALVGALAVRPEIVFNDSIVDSATTKDRVTAQYVNHCQTHNDRSMIVPGYYGHDLGTDRVRLLGRGGSDRSAVIYATSLNADCEIWTDVSGIYCANPREIPDAYPLKEVTRDEVREGYHGGSEVLQGDTVLDLEGSDIDLVVKNTFQPNDQGTRVVKQRQVPTSESIVMISSRPLTEIEIRDKTMTKKVGYMANVLGVLASHNISIEHIPTAQDAATITISDEVDLELLEKASEEIRTHNPYATVRLHDRAAVYLTSESMRNASTRMITMARLGLHLASCRLTYETQVDHPSSPAAAILTARDQRQLIQEEIFNFFLRK